MVQTVSVPGVGDLDFPDGMSQEDMAAAIKKNFTDIHTQENSNPQPKDSGIYYGDPSINVDMVPTVQGMAGFEQAREYDNRQAEIAAANKAPEPSIYDKNMAVLKATGVMAGNAIPATLGALGGSAYGLYRSLSGQQENGESMQKGAELLSPFSTNDPLANEYLGKAGEALSPLAGLPGAGGEINAISRLAPGAARQILTKPQRVIDGAQANRQDVVNRIASGSGDKDLAKIMLDRPVKYVPPEKLTAEEVSSSMPDRFLLPAPESQSKQVSALPETIKAKTIKDDLAINAIKQGYDESRIASLKSKNPETQRAALKMVQISEEGKKNRDFALDNRPSDVVGDQIAARLSYVKSVNSEAGRSLDKVAETLKNQEFDASKPVNNFIQGLEEHGVKLDKKNRPIYEDSDFEGDDASQKILNIVIRRARDTKDPNAYDAHRLKRFIDNKVNYGVSKEGLTGDAEQLVKKLRADIDGSLDGSFPAYDEVNTKYSDSVLALNDFQKAAGTSINLFGDNSSTALGTVSRRLFSNAQSRANLIDALKSVDDVTKKYGGEFKEDIRTLADFSDELDRVHGAHAKTSLLGDVEKGTATGIKNAQRDLSQTTLTGAILQGGAKAYDYLNRITPETQYKSIKELLARGAKEKKKNE